MTGMPSRRVDEVLTAVGLTGAASRRVGTYSLGMRQRLGLAQALIAEPSVLILDEPATGLDPEGIAWIRGLLRDFADRGGTVLLSSHLLAEVQATADHLVVINDGRIVAAGVLSDLLAASGLIVRAGDQTALCAPSRLEPPRLGQYLAVTLPNVRTCCRARVRSCEVQPATAPALARRIDAILGRQ